MTYTDHNRISHRQLYCQLCLSLPAPLLLCLFGRDRLNGAMGVAGTLAAAVLLGFYVIVLVRLTPHYEELGKDKSRISSWIAGVLFLSYIILTAAYLLDILEAIVPKSLLEGVSGRWITFLAALTCCIGAGKGLPKRGRIAEVWAGVFLGAAALMMLLSLGQASPAYFRELGADGRLAEGFFRNLYVCLCAFSGLGLLPFALGETEKQGSARKPVLYGILTVAGILLGTQLLLPAVFGEKRLLQEPYPVLLLLAGADLPGNVLARFDVLWMGFVLYGMLFAIGSLFSYGNRVLLLLRRTAERKETAPHDFDGMRLFLLAASAWTISAVRPGGTEISKYYPGFLSYVFVPALLVFQMYLLMRPGKKSRLKKTAALVCVLGLLTVLGGCAGIDPEKRLYPLAMGIDRTGEEYTVSFGIPRLPQATGQSSPEEDSSSYLAFTGSTFEEIREAYDRSQEKYPDLGHLQVLLLGKGILENGELDPVFDYLRQDPMVGETVYLFYTQDPSEILKWQGMSGTSVGEYLAGILENRMHEKGEKGVTLREACHQFYETGTLRELPEVRRDKNVLNIYGLQETAAASRRLVAWWGTLYPQFCFEGDPEHAKGVKVSFWLAKVLNW